MTRPHIFCVLYSLTAVASFAVTSNSPSSASTSALTGDSGTSSTITSPARTPRAYTSVKGDSFTSVAKMFGCSVRSLKKLNKIKGTHLKPGTDLEIPVSSVATHHTAKKSSSPAITIAIKKPAALSAKEQHRLALEEALKATDKYSHHSPVAQPVQDFDIPPTEFAGCPPTPSAPLDSSYVGSADDGGTPATSAPAPSTREDSSQLIVQNQRVGLLPVPATLPPSVPAPATEPATPKSFAANRGASTPSSSTANNLGQVLSAPTAPKKTLASAIADFFGGSHGMSASESGEWGNRFLVETRNLAGQGICYDGSWRPDGESHRWEMDCSNTTRYLYQVTAGIQLPRTASDQYYYLHLQDKAWDVPMAANGFADCNFLRSNLKPGDLLFWENTYRPERQPPITHVMIFLGSDARGRWLMAGSQGSKGMYNSRHSGPDVYVFNPTHAVGGYTTWLGLVHHHGRFVAYGRPLEADVKKLSVAAND